MTSHDINIALSYLDEGLLEEHFIYKEKLKRRERAIKSIVRFAPIAACICIVFAATALLLPKLAREPAPPTPDGQIQMGGVDGYNSTQSDNKTEETTNNNCNSAGFENGFTFDYSDESNPISCAYKSDKNVFDIDDVSLDFYFGAIYTNPDGIILNLSSYPAFELYFSTYDEKILIKRVEEELISDKYKRVYEISEDFRTITYDYVYSERFTIPKELFTSDNGILWFTINAAEDSTDPADFRSIAGIWLYYKKIDNTILLSSDGNFEIAADKKLDTSNDVSIIDFEDNFDVIFNGEKNHFRSNEPICVSYSFPNIIKNILDYSQYGFSNISIKTDDINNTLILNLSCDNTLDEHYIKIPILLENSKTVAVSLYAITNEYGTFISQFSLDDAREHFFEYAENNSILSKYDCDNIRMEYYRQSVIENVTIGQTTLPNNISTLSRTSNTTIISGTLQWIDDNGSIHPLRHVMVEIYDKDIIFSTLIETVYTDNYGTFFCELDNEEILGDFGINSIDVFVRVYAGDDNVILKIGESNNRYFFDSLTYYDVPLGEPVTINQIFIMDSDLGKAFQISQAAITARDYFQVLREGQLPPYVNIQYPNGNKCSYSVDTSTISITGNTPSQGTTLESYASWDVIMHEYGHHVQRIYGLTSSIGGDHYSEWNLADYYRDKSIAIHLTWGEAWPTVFALMAQQYYFPYLSNIETVGDSYYSSYNGLNYDIESTDIRSGEACERSIMAILWDLYDDTNDTYDTISLGHTGMWELVKGNRIDSFSVFVSYFYMYYPEYIDDISPNLTYYKMASSKPSISSAGNATTPPTFTWTPQGGSTFYPNNSFVLIFYNGLGEEILRTESTTSSSYTLTMAEWNAIRAAYGRTYSVAVAASQTATPVTGEYISDRLTNCRKPAVEAITETINISSSNKYLERVVSLIPKQYAEYTLTFETGGTKLIQTFGTKNPVISITNTSGTVLYTSDYTSGYSENALISLNFEANTQYIIRVQFYSADECGDIKLAIIPAQDYHNSTTTSITKYEDIYEIDPRLLVVYSIVSETNYVNVLTFTPMSDGSYTFEVDGNTYSCIYVIDPRSTSLLVFNVDYTTSNVYMPDPYLTITLEEGVPYLIICSAYNISTATSSDIIYLTITYNS